MTNSSESPSTESPSISLDPHADKYNDPRVKITRRGVMLGVLVTLLGIVGAAASIYARKTRLEKTTKFWGEEIITAFQLGEKIFLRPLAGRDFKEVDLTRAPGIGHLRRLLLDERNYDWTTVAEKPISEACSGSEPYCVQLKFTDPTGHRFQDVHVNVDLKGGWLGSTDADDSVRISERKQNALKKFLEQLVNFQEQRAGYRE